MTFIWAAVVLVASADSSRLWDQTQIRWSRAMTGRNLSESKPQPQVVESEPESREPCRKPEPEVEVVEAEETFVEEPVWEEPEDEPQSRGCG